MTRRQVVTVAGVATSFLPTLTASSTTSVPVPLVEPLVPATTIRSRWVPGLRPFTVRGTCHLVTALQLLTFAFLTPST